jgi:hypothetical protein
MVDTVSVSGSCLCGASAFEATLPSRFCAHCHCDNCRRAHGAAFVTWVGFASAQFRWTAADAIVRSTTDTDAVRSFCGKCGSTLTYEGPRWKDEVHVVRANIDGAIDHAPALHVYVDHKASWWSIDDDLPQRGGKTGTEPRD